MPNPPFLHQNRYFWISSLLCETSQYLVADRFVVIHQIGNCAVNITYGNMASPRVLCVVYLAPCGANQCLLRPKVPKHSLYSHASMFCNLIERNLIYPEFGIKRYDGIDNSLAC